MCTMEIYRYQETPLITPKDVPPLRPDFEVIGAFNAGVAEYNGELIMLLRVAERPIRPDAHIVKAPVFNPSTRELVIKEFDLRDPAYDVSDPRVIRERGKETWSYLTSLSYL